MAGQLALVEVVFLKIFKAKQYGQAAFDGAHDHLNEADETRLRFNLPSHGTLRARVYFNLHQHVFSVKAMEGEHKGKVVAHTPILMITDVTPHVSEAGRQRVLQERSKNVHAYLQGTIDLAHLHDPSLIQVDPAPYRRISYDPYKGPCFVYVYPEENFPEFKFADRLLLTAHDRGIWEPLN